MSDVVLLRTLTEKSILKFGKYAELTVFELINKDNINYLRWVYYHCSNITFKPEVLDLIKIPIEFRIEKPGTNEQMYKDLKVFIFESLPENLQKRIIHKTDKMSKKYYKGKLGALTRQSNFKNSKDSLTRKNHGY